MDSKIEKHLSPDANAAGIDPAKVAGGTECAPSELVPDVAPLYDALVDATSAVIERVMTAGKTF